MANDGSTSRSPNIPRSAPRVRNGPNPAQPLQGGLTRPTATNTTTHGPNARQMAATAAPTASRSPQIYPRTPPPPPTSSSPIASRSALSNSPSISATYQPQQQSLAQSALNQAHLAQSNAAGQRILAAARYHNPNKTHKSNPQTVLSSPSKTYPPSMVSDSGSETESTVFDDMHDGQNGFSAVTSSASTEVASISDSDRDEITRDDGLKKSFPSKSRALIDLPPDETGEATPWRGKTKLVMTVLSEMWLVHILCIFGGTYVMTFVLPQSYTDTELWNVSCWWKLAWLFPMPYTLVCLFGLALPFRTTKFINREGEVKARRLDNLYILTVTKGDNREAVYRSWNAHRHLERLHPCVRVHVLTDEPYYFENINCYTCPRSFIAPNALYKARALEWYRQTMRYTEHDWVLHLDEESVVDDETIRRILDFIWYEPQYWWGQGPIFYNQWGYWSNWIFTVADALRVGDDLSRFQLQYTYFHRPIFGAHGSFLLTNGLVENAITWDLGSLTEDYQFAVKAWERGFLCGKVSGIVREQSPQRLVDFLKQRRRWYVGIRRLPLLLPKIWAFFWTLGIICLYGTILSVVLGFIIPLGTPRWFGLLKDLTFVTFVYLYLLGVFIQDLDRGLLLWNVPQLCMGFSSHRSALMSSKSKSPLLPMNFEVIKK
ncbi:hypothetical protein SeLEV6574_g04776 [Synchytrium endobioticum]|uniref:Glycosyltransferase 2-like domain-containing protein n=1 Tax=Synchytrium endobioticum TaxID=286115 RepID=A0A507CXS7_9FUNG|nr:hypothetical protein SeLEV6574_g04776 [Synchytrium endobioticum]